MRPLTPARIAIAALISALLAFPALSQQAGAGAGLQPTGPATAQNQPVPVIQMPGGIPVSVDPPPAPPSSSILTGMNWLERPAAADYARLYPLRARNQGVSGNVSLDCLVDGEGRLACAVLSEDPPEYGFGDATLRLMRTFRAAPQTTDGRPTAGGRVRQTITWRMG